MVMYQSAEAAKLALISPAQLREWTKRGIVCPDVAGRGAGHPTLFSWQTILVLSVIAELRSEFGIELGRWTGAAQSAREAIEQCSFLRLWGGALVFRSGSKATLEWRRDVETSSTIRVALDPHLDRLASEMQLPGAPSQLPLLAPVGGRR